ncbi:hypothetical protein EXIGLDRAFT_321718 [Exidia glandulosa HHB12029]|uniref:Uncharacterized protein n=1 Tax=Exidia glandulosa HHB12029 TaxID=1314781 RepID=A0A165LRQ3_EXIGL|nr:hypothetical protein EXIGLDRAFT_321718 [Exidia glandulosa HHB12029]
MLYARHTHQALVVPSVTLTRFFFDLTCAFSRPHALPGLSTSPTLDRYSISDNTTPILLYLQACGASVVQAHEARPPTDYARLSSYSFADGNNDRKWLSWQATASASALPTAYVVRLRHLERRVKLVM